MSCSRKVTAISFSFALRRAISSISGDWSTAVTRSPRWAMARANSPGPHATSTREPGAAPWRSNTFMTQGMSCRLQRPWPALT